MQTRIQLSEWLSRVVDAHTAAGFIRSGNKVFMPGNCAEPKLISEALAGRASELKNVIIYQLLTLSNSPFARPEMEGHFRLKTPFIGAGARSLVKAGKADLIPCILSQVPFLFSRNILPLDAAVAHVSMPDENGYCSLGVESGIDYAPAKAAKRDGKIVIAEMNEQMPYIYGRCLMHIKEFDYIVLANYPITEIEGSSEGGGDIINKIGFNLASMIEPGATLQIGIGAILNAFFRFLPERGDSKDLDLGIHSEIITEGVMDLVEKGIITGRKKTLHPGKIITGIVLGSKIEKEKGNFVYSDRLYKFINENPMVELHPTEYVNDPQIIRKNFGMTAINAALEGDLTGNFCGDSVGHNFYSGIGGQSDFIYGASLARLDNRGGKPIIAMESTYFDKKLQKLQSKIVPLLKQGAGITTGRNNVHYVVTEYGRVDLFGKDIPERAKALISIAHPEFREWLAQGAYELWKISV